MPSLTSPLPPPSKKRRFPDADDDDAATPEQHLAILPGAAAPRRWDRPDVRAGREKSERWGLARRIVPVALAKRARVADEERRRVRSPARGGRDGGAGDAADAGAGGKAGRTSLAACHICHRRPTKKSVLDSFADCEGCGERTCFVCIRECAGPMPRGEQPPPGQQVQQGQDHQRQSQQPQPQRQEVGDDDDEVREALSRSFCMDDADGPAGEEQRDGDGRRDRVRGGEEGWWGAGGHRGVVCSRCCVEMGRDGEIACLGCLSRMEGA